MPATPTKTNAYAPNGFRGDGARWEVSDSTRKFARRKDNGTSGRTAGGKLCKWRVGAEPIGERGGYRESGNRGIARAHRPGGRGGSGARSGGRGPGFPCLAAHSASGSPSIPLPFSRNPVAAHRRPRSQHHARKRQDTRGGEGRGATGN